jgi:hypothetical protein
MNSSPHIAPAQYGPGLEACPENHRSIIEEIAREPATREIWLIGSRANSRAKYNSDCDILVFRDDDLSEVQARCEGLDVLRVSQGQFLLEGRSKSSILPFANFSWLVIDREHASYIGYDFPKESAPQDASEPPVARPQLRALLIYKAGG